MRRLLGYTSGPTESSVLVTFIDAIMLNNGKHKALVRTRQYNLGTQPKSLVVDETISVPAGSALLVGLEPLIAYEVQFITNSPLVRFYVAGFSQDYNIVPDNRILHRELAPFKPTGKKLLKAGASRMPAVRKKIGQIAKTGV
ncbi:MAG: hypothetical protein ACM3PP_06165 [Candidatus Saccharibacteria bacterium]